MSTKCVTVASRAADASERSKRPATGSQPRLVAKNSCSSRPSQKMGTDTSSAESQPLIQSGMWPLERAAATPSGMPTPTAMSIAVPTSSSEAIRRTATSPSTGWRVWMEVPQSPRSRSVR